MTFSHPASEKWASSRALRVFRTFDETGAEPLHLLRNRHVFPCQVSVAPTKFRSLSC